MSDDLIHGGALDQIRTAFPSASEPWIDLSTGINPWPYPNITISEATLVQLPTQSAQEACREVMASAIGVKPDALLLAPGSELLIRLLPNVIRPQRIAILSPTYGDHAAVWERAGVEVIETDDPLGLVATVDAAVVTHPNNPDGRVFDREMLEAARRDLLSRGGWLIIDEAYADLMLTHSMSPRGGADGLIILRSFGKFFGLPGLRLGALIAPQPIRDEMAWHLGCWPISGPALDIATRAYADYDWQSRTRTNLSKAAAQLDIILKASGLDVIGGTSLYRFVKVPDADGLFERLARAGIYVRRFGWSPSHLRIGLPPTVEAASRLKAALNSSV